MAGEMTRSGIKTKNMLITRPDENPDHVRWVNVKWITTDYFDPLGPLKNFFHHD
jgi:hypothetical protein